MSEWVCLNCKSINRPSARACYSCGSAPGAEPTAPSAFPVPGIAAAVGAAGGPAAAVAVAGVPFGLGAEGGSMSLAGEAVLATAPATPATTAGPMDLVGGAVGGVVGAVAASAVWYAVVAATQFQVGLVAIAVGWIVGQAVVFGAQRRFSVALIPISVVLTLLALAASEYLIVLHFFSQEFGAVDFVQPPALVLDVIMASLQADPLTLVFWAIALFQAFIIPARVARPSAGEER